MINKKNIPAIPDICENSLAEEKPADLPDLFYAIEVN